MSQWHVVNKFVLNRFFFLVPLLETPAEHHRVFSACASKTTPVRTRLGCLTAWRNTFGAMYKIWTYKHRTTSMSSYLRFSALVVGIVTHKKCIFSLLCASYGTADTNLRPTSLQELCVRTVETENSISQNRDEWFAAVGRWRSDATAVYAQSQSVSGKSITAVTATSWPTHRV